MSTTTNCANKERTSFTCMEFTQFFCSYFFAFSIKVQALTAYHTKVTCAHCHFAYNFNQNCRVNILLFQHYFKCQSQKTVACQNCHSFTINFVVGQTTTTIVIIVHARQIIMNQGISMNHFQTASYRQEVITFFTQSFCSSHQKYRTDTFAACKQAISHSIVNFTDAFFRHSSF